MANKNDIFYMNWVYQIVNFPGVENYGNLLKHLSETDFYFLPHIPLDKNRALDVYSLREDYISGQCSQSPKTYIYTNTSSEFLASSGKEYIYTNYPSVLEVMVALVRRCENSFMYDPNAGNRCGLWFQEMLKSMDLLDMTDDYYNSDYVDMKIETLLSRTYSEDGHGGLFTLRNPRSDMRYVDIWTQALWWFNEYYTDIVISEEYYEG